MGKGKHTVIFENAMGNDLTLWMPVQEKLADNFCTIAYDRAGLGKSEISMQKRSCYIMAKELHKMLYKLKILPPYIYVGASYGAFVIRAFSELYKNELEGIVLVEPSHEDFFVEKQKYHTEVENKNYKKMLDYFSKQSSEGYRREWESFASDCEYIKTLTFPREYPVKVISSNRCSDVEKIIMQLDEKDIELKCRLHKKWSEDNTNIEYIMTNKSGHNVLKEEPFLVIKAIKKLCKEIEVKS